MADQASRAFTALETKVAGLDAGEFGLDAAHESAVEVLDEYRAAAGRAASSGAGCDSRAGRSGGSSRGACASGSTRKDGNLGLACRCRPAERAAGIGRARWSVFKLRTRPRLQRPSAPQPMLSR